MKKINDYGRKIPFAKKDYYQPETGEYRINVSDIWPLSMVKSDDQFCRFLTRTLRKDIAGLRTKDRSKAQKYIDMVTTIRDRLLDIEEADEFFAVLREVQYGHDFFGKKLYDLDLLLKDPENGISYSVMNRAAMANSCFERSKKDIAREKATEKLWFLRYDFYTKFNEEKNLVELEIPEIGEQIQIFIPPNVLFSQQRLDSYFIVEWDEEKGERVVLEINASQGDFDQKFNALFEKELEKLTPKKPHSALRLDENPGICEGYDYLHGRLPSEEDLEQVFNLSGQFGNSFSQKQRRKALPKLYNSLANLCCVLECSPRDLSLPIGETNLGIAVGARGHGGVHSASAHYEPEFHVINLTKRSVLSGGGNVGHEFLHALDHWLYNQLVGESDNAFLTDLPEADLADLFPEMSEVVRFLRDKTTKFYQDAQSLDLLEKRRPDKAYWKTTREMFARAGSSCMAKILGKKKVRDDFLTFDFPTNVSYGGKKISACPQGRELDQLVELYENLFAAIVRKGLWRPLEEGSLCLCRKGSAGQRRSPGMGPAVVESRTQVSFF